MFEPNFVFARVEILIHFHESFTSQKKHSHLKRHENYGNDVALFYQNTHHEALLNQQNSSLVLIENLPMNSLVLFVSHEWLRDTCPDNKDGTQIEVLCTTLKKLVNGKCCTNMIWPHVVSYLNSCPYKTTASEWRSILRNAYVCCLSQS